MSVSVLCLSMLRQVWPGVANHGRTQFSLQHELRRVELER